MIGRCDLRLKRRSVSFSAWFDLALQVGIVSDSEWENGEYCVEAFDGWHPYAEMVAAFSLTSLGMILAGGESDDACDEI